MTAPDNVLVPRYALIDVILLAEVAHSMTQTADVRAMAMKKIRAARKCLAAQSDASQPGTKPKAECATHEERERVAIRLRSIGSRNWSGPGDTYPTSGYLVSSGLMADVLASLRSGNGGQDQ